MGLAEIWFQTGSELLCSRDGIRPNTIAGMKSPLCVALGTTGFIDTDVSPNLICLTGERFDGQGPMLQAAMKSRSHSPPSHLLVQRNSWIRSGLTGSRHGHSECKARPEVHTTRLAYQF
ncbi:hypothetical protein L345_07919, partial [Ophiophagus hannah]